MTNPFRAPRPKPIDPECLTDGWCLDDLLRPDALIDLLQDNFDWLCHGEHSTREIYTALFRRVDPHGSHQREAMDYINETMWDLEFRTIGEKPHAVNPTWRWVKVA